MSESKSASSASAALKASCIYAGDVLKGHHAINPAGNLVKLPPGSVRLAVSLEKGEYIEGLKDGWRLGSKADFDAKAKEEADRQKKEASSK